MNLPDAHVIHSTPGRVRIRVASRHRDEAFFAQARTQLAQLEGVKRVEANALTGSVVILHALELGALVRHCERAGLFRLSLVAPALVPASAEVSERVRGANRIVSSLAGGRIDFATLGFATLVGAAIYQASRGQLLGPAVTLLFQAITALSLSRK
jgi:hypothetical protein